MTERLSNADLANIVEQQGQPVDQYQAHELFGQEQPIVFVGKFGDCDSWALFGKISSEDHLHTIASITNSASSDRGSESLRYTFFTVPVELISTLFVTNESSISDDQYGSLAYPA